MEQPDWTLATVKTAWKEAETALSKASTSPSTCCLERWDGHSSFWACIASWRRIDLLVRWCSSCSTKINQISRTDEHLRALKGNYE